MYTNKRTSLTDKDVEILNRQYYNLEVKYTNIFHDRFMILDRKIVYHIGASVKDAGKKCFGISFIEDAKISKAILNQVEDKE